MRRFHLTQLLAGSLALQSFAAAQVPDAHIDDLNLGKYWYGSEVDHKDLRGKVVLVEIWGS